MKIISTLVQQFIEIIRVGGFCFPYNPVVKWLHGWCLNAHMWVCLCVCVCVCGAHHEVHTKNLGNVQQKLH